MKRLLLASFTSMALAAGATIAAPAPGASHFALGVVQTTDRAGGTATVMHEQVATLNWPAMTMQFSVADPALFERLPAGRQVAFEFVAGDGAYRIVSAIPLSNPAGAPSMGGREGQTQDGMTMGGMSGMQGMCMDIMGQSRKRWWQFWK